MNCSAKAKSNSYMEFELDNIYLSPHYEYIFIHIFKEMISEVIEKDPFIGCSRIYNQTNKLFND